MTAAKIYVAGHAGMVGSAIVRALRSAGEAAIVTRTRTELDLANQAQVRAFFEVERPDQVYMAAARVGRSASPFERTSLCALALLVCWHHSPSPLQRSVQNRLEPRRHS